MFFQAASNFLSPESLVMKHVEVSKKLYSVFHAMDDFKSLGMKTPDEFLTHLTERLKGLPLMDLAMKSKSQSASPLWHALRFGRITASKLYEAANCSTICGSFYAFNVTFDIPSQAFRKYLKQVQPQKKSCRKCN
ncbi:hypothetical protein M8J76_011959 [Diaphorina citri]|nr:hypothetical protein M8J76_011959 [Diaphorina citri]